MAQLPPVGVAARLAAPSVGGGGAVEVDVDFDGAVRVISQGPFSSHASTEGAGDERVGHPQDQQRDDQEDDVEEEIVGFFVVERGPVLATFVISCNIKSEEAIKVGRD